MEGLRLPDCLFQKRNGEDVEALETLVCDSVLRRMVENGFDPSEITNGMIFRNKNCLTALKSAKC